MTEGLALQKCKIADAAARALLDLPSVLAVALFGSVARGAPSDRSDIDLLVLVNTPLPRHSMLISELPGPLAHPDLSLSTYTEHELTQKLRNWSRFAAHLRREGRILHDSEGKLATILSAEIPISVKYELESSRKYLHQFSHMDRFGGRMLFPLAHLYTIGRVAVLARLFQHGDLEFDKGQAFAKLQRFDPGLAADVDVIGSLEPFYDFVRQADAEIRLPFDPIGLLAEARAIEAKEAVLRILAVGETHDVRT